MRIYTESSEENLRSRKLLKQWANDGLLSKDQHQSLEQETVCELRTTNIFLRIVLFLFTILGVAAAVGLFFTIFLSRPSPSTTGILLLLFGAVAYMAAEIAVNRASFYRYGIEEALAVCSVAFVCAGLELFFFSGSPNSAREAQFLVPGAGAIALLWVWYRFNLWYAFPAAIVFVVFPPAYWTSSDSVQRVFIAALYAVGLICIARLRRRHSFDYLEDAYSLAEAFLWFGIYVAFNLKISALSLPVPWRYVRSASAFAVPFYWMTWVLTWCLPPLILMRGIRLKDRMVMAAGTITAVFTLVTNKPYLGWHRHTWDPMLLGLTLAGVAFFLRRWLAQGPDGVRYGFTAAHLSGKDKQAMGMGSAVLGLVTPAAITPAPQPAAPEFHFGGGSSGGGGVSGDF